MSDTKDRSGAPPTKTFDEAWSTLPEGKTSEARPGASGSKGDTKAWTEDVRAARKRDAPAPDDADEMDRLMKEGLRGAVPGNEDDIPASASASALEFSALEVPQTPKAKPDDAMMEALMGGSADTAEPVQSRPEEDDDAEPSPPIVLHPNRAGRPKAAPNQQVPKPAARAKPKKNRTPLIVGGAVAAGLALWFGREPPAPAPKKKTAEPAAVVVRSAPIEDEAPDPKAPQDPTALADPSAASGAARRPPAEPLDPNRDPRVPPPGTPPEIAAVFEKLPVSPADRAPVGGVGATGVHIDDVSMGSAYERSRCTGSSKSFSVSKDDHANVCIRVVHPREKEELSIVWQKVDGNARRGKIVVKPLHAYRTRAYLKLRSEYVGDWVVTVYSDDGVELAQLPFAVVP